VTDEHRRLVACPNQTLVVVDDLLYTEAGRLLCALADLLDVSVLARPLGSRDGEATLVELVRVVLPAAGGQPGAVNQDQWDLAVVGLRGCHVFLLVRFAGETTLYRRPSGAL
jgi:hypothetical protein